MNKILIQEAVQGVEHCPHCEEHLIQEIVSQISLDDDIEEATQIACDELMLCTGCKADEESDNKRI